MQTDEVVEVATGPKPVGSVIWLHGLGADGHDFEPIVPELRLPVAMPLRFLFPHAPVRPVTVNGGMAMRAWYDIVSLDKNGRADAEGVAASTAIVEGLIQREIERGVAAENIVVAGFSQGGAIALNTMLTSKRSIAGVMALSTYLAVPSAASASDTRRDIPFFMAHGALDPVLPLQLGRDSREFLSNVGFVIDWREYSMAHAVCTEEIADISTWLQSIFAT